MSPRRPLPPAAGAGVPLDRGVIPGGTQAPAEPPAPPPPADQSTPPAAASQRPAQAPAGASPAGRKRSTAQAQAPAEQAPPPLTDPERKHWRWVLRSTAGKIAAALQELEDAQTQWRSLVEQATERGVPPAMIMAALLDAGIEDIGPYMPDGR